MLYPLWPYPVIREFAAMLEALKPGEQGWMGREFFGYTGKGSTAFNFRGGATASWWHFRRKSGARSAS